MAEPTLVQEQGLMPEEVQRQPPEPKEKQNPNRNETFRNRLRIREKDM